MQRRVPKSDKYDHVQGRLDTGLTVAKVRTISASEYSRRRDEIFFRITPSQLFELYCEYENDEEENIDGPSFSGSGAAPRIITHSDSSAPEYNKPYLILDVREDFEYRSCHVQQARSYPTAMMRRDYVHPELYTFRNKPGCLIIVYCDDERVSCEAAKVLVGRGTDNVYVLTGGMKEFYFNFPTYIEGNPPDGFVDTRRKTTSAMGGTSGGRLSTGRSSATPDSSIPTTARMRAHAAASGHTSGGRVSRTGDTRSVSAMSGVSTASVAESIISRASARKGKF